MTDPDTSHRCISSVQNQYSSTDCYLYGGIVFRLKSFSLGIIPRERLTGVAVQRPSNVGEGVTRGAQLKGRGDGVGNDGLQEASRAPLSSVMRRRENEGSLINAKCTIRVCYGPPQSTIYGVFFELPGG